MEQKNLTPEQKNLLDQLTGVQQSLKAKREKEGFVVAGSSKDGTYYAFVGEGRGYKGASLSPASSFPVIFNSRKAAEREAVNGYYSNGHGNLINLEVVEASVYFGKLYEDVTKSIEWLNNQFAK